jgi:hypothetical protein
MKPMTPSVEFAIQQDVNRGIELHRRIKTYQAELEMINARLQLVALNGPQVDLGDPELEGKQFLAQGTEVKVPIVITSDSIIGECLEDSKNHLAIKAAADGFFPKFYKRVVGYARVPKDSKAFRLKARELLGDKAPAFIEVCKSRDKDGLAKNAIKVEWDRAEATKQPLTPA